MSTKIALPIYVFLDLLCVAAGMGVPLFCILLGFPVGWYIARRAVTVEREARSALRVAFTSAALTSAFTFALMCAIWGPSITMLFDPAADLSRLGIPMILYEPKASFIGWLVLMILISPFLQLLTTLCASFLTLLRHSGSGNRGR